MTNMKSKFFTVVTAVVGVSVVGVPAYAGSCEWTLTVSEQDNELVSMNMGTVLPKKTSFKVADMAHCSVFNEGQVYTVCTFNDSNKSISVSPLDTLMGKISNMTIFDGSTEDSSKKYFVLTMCASM